jgi:hypothetical protein
MFLLIITILNWLKSHGYGRGLKSHGYGCGYLSLVIFGNSAMFLLLLIITILSWLKSHGYGRWLTDTVMDVATLV